MSELFGGNVDFPERSFSGMPQVTVGMLRGDAYEQVAAHMSSLWHDLITDTERLTISHEVRVLQGGERASNVTNGLADLLWHNS